MNALRKVVDKALWFFGGRESKPAGRAGKDARNSASGSSPGTSSLSSGASGTWVVPVELRAQAEVERYENLAEKLDTRLQADRGWLKCLLGADPWQSMKKPGELDLALADRTGHALCARLYDLISHLVAEFNNHSPAIISLTPPSEVSEKRKVTRSPGAAEVTETVTYFRWRASTGSWALSCRARFGIVEVFLVPASDLMALSQAEAQLRLMLRLELRKVSDRLVWMSDSLPIAGEELKVSMRKIFRDLVSSTLDQEQPAQTISAMGNLDDPRIARSIEQLLIERENLAQKVVIQQEEIQKRIARDLHDAVISDVMALKRTVASNNVVPAEELLASMEGIVRKLREICYDLSPRDLSDWGLTTVVEDMLDQMAQRTGIDCVLNCDIEMPVMPAAVLLHIYRIIQESLNNAEKYAEPTRVAVTIEMDKEKFVVIIADNGKGFEQSAGSEKSGREGGYGMGSLKERADLIRCFYPTKFFINSAPGKGSQVRLEIDLARFQ